MRTRRTLLLIAILSLPHVRAAGPSSDGIEPQERETFIGLRVISAVFHTIREESGRFPSTGGVLRELDRSFILDLGAPYADYLPSKDGWGRPYYVLASLDRLVAVSAGADGVLDDREAIVSLLHNPAGSVYTAKTIDGDDVIALGHTIAKRSPGHRERQMRTVADMRSLGSALTAYLLEHQSCPPVEGVVFAPEMRKYLVPTYLRESRARDGWDSEFLFWCEHEEYLIISPGADGTRDEPYFEMTNPPAEIVARGVLHDAGRDIIFENGAFRTIPYGISP